MDIQLQEERVCVELLIKADVRDAASQKDARVQGTGDVCCCML